MLSSCLDVAAAEMYLTLVNDSAVRPSDQDDTVLAGW